MSFCIAGATWVGGDQGYKILSSLDRRIINRRTMTQVNATASDRLKYAQSVVLNRLAYVCQPCHINGLYT